MSHPQSTPGLLPVVDRLGPETSAGRRRLTTRQLSLRQVNVLRIGYVVMGVGLAVIKWPLLVSHEPWSLAEGTKECLLIAMSVLALLGLRYPVRMLPILLFEVAWKLLWLGVVAFPLVLHGNLTGATRTQAAAILWVVVIIAVIPWRHVVVEYLLTPADPWRRAREVRSA